MALIKNLKKDNSSKNLKELFYKVLTYLDETDLFLKNMQLSKRNYITQLTIKKSFRDTIVFYFDYTDYISRAEKLLEFLTQISEKLYFELSRVNSQIAFFDISEIKLKEKWDTYKYLCSILQKSPNENFRYIRFKMHNYNPNWENTLESSTKIILQKMEVGTASTSLLTENVESILKNLINQKDQFAVYNLPCLKKAQNRAQKLKVILSMQISEIKKRISVLKTFLDNSIV